MGLIKNYGTYGPGNKHLKFYDESLIAVEGANTMLKLPLCNVAVPYDQFSRSRFTIPPKAEGFEVNLGAINQAVTFLIIKPLYSKENLDKESNILTYKIGTTDNVNKEMTQIMMLSGTVKRPVPNIFINNPNEKYPVTLEILATTSTYADGEEPMDLLYANLSSDNLYSADEYTLALRDDNEYIKFYISVGSISNMELDGRTIKIDDPTHGKIGLGFNSIHEARQAMSAVSWWLQDTTNRLLPQPDDVDAPVITYTSRVRNGTVVMTLPENLIITADEIIKQCVDTIVDNRDGNITVSSDNVKITKNGSIFKNIVGEGNFIVTFTISDLAGNTAIDTIRVEATTIPDTTPPTISLTNSIVNDAYYATGNTGETITKEQIIAIAIDKIEDNRSNVILDRFDVDIKLGTEVVADIICPGIYTVTFKATDDAGNDTIKSITVNYELDPIYDVIGPAINLSSTVDSNGLVEMDLNTFNGTINSSRILEYCILSIVDAFDNKNYPMSGVEVTITDINDTEIDLITTPGTYLAKLVVKDDRDNATESFLVLNVIQNV
jgi:hypothetical protein